MATMNWKPTWWKEDMHGSAWDRVKEAMRRDWEQTKKDLHLKGGHELNQNVGDTVKQMAGKQMPPPVDKANPAKVIGDWNDVELPMGYGYGARKQFGAQHTAWGPELETKLRGEWNEGKDRSGRGFDEVKDFVRRGFEYKGDRDSHA